MGIEVDVMPPTAAHRILVAMNVVILVITHNVQATNQRMMEKYEKKELNTTPKSNSESDLTLPSETFSEGIEISGPVTDIVDGDTLDINDIRIRLALVNTPEVGEAGFVPAKEFVEGLCLDKNGQVDIDDGQRQGSFGREIGVVYCDGINLNSELMKKGYALISAEFCEVSEFSAEPWAKSSCQM